MSNSLIKTLTEKRQNLWDEQKKLLDLAASENRDFTAEETQQYEARDKDLTSMRSRIDSLVESEATNKAIEEGLRSLGVGDLSGGDPNEERGKIDMNAQFRELAQRKRDSVSLSARSVSDGIAELRALSKGTATAGGNTVPTSFRNTLLEHLVEQSGLLLLGPTILSTDSGEVFEIPVTTSHGAAALVAEAGNLATNSVDPAFAKRTLGAYKYAQLITVARELVEDTGVDLTGYLARAAGRNVGLALSNHLINGTGSGQPTGVLTTATAGKTGAAAVGGAPAADDLIDLFFSVIAPYRNSAAAGWLLKDSSLGAIRKLKDGAGRYLFEPASTVGAPDVLLGKPIQTDPYMPAIAATAESIAFGDWSAYFVRLAGGVRFERDDSFAFGTDQITFRCIIRADGVLADQTGAIKTFTGGAAA